MISDCLAQNKQQIGFVDVAGAIVEVDYVSQINKDLQKRRKHIFRLELSNGTEYLMQAPSDSRRTNW